MASISNLGVTSELDAVNTMLAVIGESPVDSITEATQANVDMAVATLRETAREVLTMGWRFNTEFGYQIAPESATYRWVDRNGIATDLNIFLPPSDLLRFEMTPDTHMRCVDAAIRDSRHWRAPLTDITSTVNYALTTNPFDGFIPGGTLEDNTDALGGSWAALTANSFLDTSGGVYLPSPVVSQPDGGYRRYLSSLAPVSPDYGVELALMDMRPAPALLLSPTVELWLRATTDAGGAVEDGYVAIFALKQDTSDTIGSVVIKKYVAGVATTLATAAAPNVPMTAVPGWGEFCSIGFSVVGGSLAALINGVAVLTADDTAPLGPAAAWGIGGSPGGVASPSVGLYKIGAAAPTFEARETTARRVFYDRANNRDGFDAERVPFLYITGVFDQDFDAMPQTARNYITRRAARIFYGRVVQEQSSSSDAMRDELFALRLLKKDQGMTEELNVFDAVNRGAYGRRARERGGYYDRRASPGRA